MRQERGAELIEMALVLPLLMLIIMGIIDFGFLFREMNVVTNAAREGARAGILPEYDADANVADRVQQYMNASGMDVTCSPPTASCTSPVIDVPPPTGTFEARDVTGHRFSPVQLSESDFRNVRRIVLERGADRPGRDAGRIAVDRSDVVAHRGSAHEPAVSDSRSS